MSPINLPHDPFSQRTGVGDRVARRGGVKPKLQDHPLDWSQSLPPPLKRTSRPRPLWAAKSPVESGFSKQYLEAESRRLEVKRGLAHPHTVLAEGIW